ncbi:MAG: hypothetical protein PHT19_14250 [Methylococcus sp.]|nr:hypothetical protein [Methylococcus sp.]
MWISLVLSAGLLGFDQTFAASPASLSAELSAAINESLRKFEPAGFGKYAAQNLENRLTLEFDGNSLSLTPASQSPRWNSRITLSGYGTPGKILPVQHAQTIALAQRLEYRRGDVIEWYENKAEGLEQGFTLARPPQPSTSEVELRLGVSGNLKATLDADGRGARLQDPAGRTALNYRKLDALDANGQHLPAKLIPSENGLAIRVDTRDAAWPIVIDPLIGIEEKLTAPDGTPGAVFGFSVAISGDTAVVGALGSGAAYVLARPGSETPWNEQAKLTAPGKAAFGAAVAVSGDTVLVAAPQANDGTGSVYVFVRPEGGVTWSQQAELSASDAVAGDTFGRAVALAGNTAIIGASTVNAATGAAYVFVRSDGETAWRQQAKLYAFDGQAGDLFGSSVALSGNTALVGMVGGEKRTGAAYVFARLDNEEIAWSEQAKLTSTEAVSGDLFGISVALSGDTALVGAPGAKTGTGAAYVFARRAGEANWTQQAELTVGDASRGSAFGCSVGVSGDLAIVGAYNVQNEPGAAYVFARADGDTTWSEQAKLVASDGEAHNDFGSAVALSGSTAMAGAMGTGPKAGNGMATGSAYVYNLQQGESHTLNVAASTGGTITSQPAGIRCGDKCSENFAEGTSITLAATPAPSYAFTAWTGCDSVSGNVCTVILTADKTVSAGFIQTHAQLPLSIVLIGPVGSGSVISYPDGISCGTTCNAYFDKGSKVTLGAVANIGSGYKFKGWSGGGCKGKKPCVVRMNKAKTVKATFVQKNY